MVDDKNKFWGKVCGILSVPVAGIAAIGNGVYKAASGEGTFTEGADEAAGKIIETAEEFGKNHGNTITNGLIRGAAIALGGTIANETLKHPKHPST